MNILESVANYLKGNKNNLEVAEGYCPNCWGQQTYEGKFLELMQTERIDLNNVTAKKGWIQAHAVKHFEGIKVKQTSDAFECPSCKLRIKPTS